MKLPVIQEASHNVVEFDSFLDLAQPIYLDNCSTTKLDFDALNAMIKAMEINYGNSGSIHKAGQKAKELVEEARSHVASFIGCNSDEVIFNSGATESICSVFDSVMKTHYPKKTIISCLTEHSATLSKLKQIEEINYPKYNIKYLGVNNNGHFNIERLQYLLQQNPNDNLIVSLLAVNNETGTIHNNLLPAHGLIGAIELTHKYGGLFHIDAVQAAGKISLKPYIDAGVDFLSLSGHKLHAVKGVGALYIKKDIPFIPLIVGGSHENNRRAGTENVPGIVGLGVVASKKPIFGEEIKKLHNIFINELKARVPSCIINGGGLPGIVSVGFKYVNRQAIVMKLSMNNVYAGMGSACSSGIQPSHVLKEMKVAPEYINGSVRFSMSKYTTENEIRRAVEIIGDVYDEVRSWSKGIVT